jgi:hypothetical protein
MQDKDPLVRSQSMSAFAEITPHDLAALSLCRAADSLEQAVSDPATWFLIILDLHRAVYCALIAALAGSAQVGVYSDKLRAEWLAYFERSRDDPNANAPTGDYVLSFKELLSKAENDHKRATHRSPYAE